MAQTFEDFQLERIRTLRSEAASKTAEAAALEKSLADWRRARGIAAQPQPDVLKGVFSPAQPLPPFRAPPAKNGHALQEGSLTYMMLKFIYESHIFGLSIGDLYKLFKDREDYDKEAAIRSMAYSQKALDRIKLVNNRYYYPEFAPKEIGRSSSNPEGSNENRTTEANL